MQNKTKWYTQHTTVCPDIVTRGEGHQRLLENVQWILNAVPDQWSRVIHLRYTHVSQIGALNRAILFLDAPLSRQVGIHLYLETIALFEDMRHTIIV